MADEVGRIVALGASNLTRGFQTIVGTARSVWGPDVEMLAAFGRGRSYGAPSRFVVRTLPGILKSGLWTELERRPPFRRARVVVLTCTRTVRQRYRPTCYFWRWQSKNCALIGEECVADIREVYGVLMRRAITGVLLGAIVGAVQVWFFKQGLIHLFAAIAAGVIYMTTWVLFTDWLKLAGGKIVLGAVSGLLAAVVWWAIAIHADNVFLSAVVAGACFGAAYAWSDRRMT